MKFFRAVLRLLQAVSPHAAAWLAERLFFTARRTALSPAARAFLVTGRKFTLRVEGRRVVGWRWGPAGAPLVYLVHGWGSRGARLAAFAGPLLDAGYGVVTYDAVGQGASARGMTSMPEFARTLVAVVAREGPGPQRTPHAIIAHSMGCAGTTLALSWGLEVERLIFLAPAADPPAWVDPFARMLGLRADVVERVRARSERRLRVRWAELNVCDIARRMSRRPELLIAHDEADETVPWQDGAAVAAAWPESRFVTTQGLGHRGVTTDPHVVRQAVAFVTQDARESGQLGYEMFHRDERQGLS